MFATFVVVGFSYTSSVLPQTGAYFMDSATSADNHFGAGYWIPELTIAIDPGSPDGDHDFYDETPCFTLSSTLADDVTLWYEFSDDGNPTNDTKYPGGCVEFPDGNPSPVQAIAVHDDNPDWKSAVVALAPKVDTMCPAVGINMPEEGDSVSGTVDIKGTIIDANPQHYWLVVEDETGSQVAGPGVVSESDSIESPETLMSWDTTAVDDGEYTIKLEARDGAGNKCPNESPVSSDPDEEGDSVYWITVDVDNSEEDATDEGTTDGDLPAPAPEEEGVEDGDVVINEIMWMGSDESTADEWIELRNTTDDEIDITGWRIDNAKSGGGDFVIEDSGAVFTVPVDGYFLIARKTEGDSAMSVDPDLVASMSFSNTYSSNGALFLRDAEENLIDRTPEPTGSDWPAGEKKDGETTTYHSMERNDTPEDGTDEDDWHTCISDTCNDGTFWDVDNGVNYGTPGDESHSENDPTSKENSTQDKDEGEQENDEGKQQSESLEAFPEEETLPEEEMPITEEEEVDNEVADSEGGENSDGIAKRRAWRFSEIEQSIGDDDTNKENTEQESTEKNEEENSQESEELQSTEEGTEEEGGDSAEEEEEEKDKGEEVSASSEDSSEEEAKEEEEEVDENEETNNEK